jgi:hypothetical protein
MAGSQKNKSGGDLSLGNTVDVFESRLQRKLKKQEIVQDSSRKEAEVRHARMLQAMTTIRKAIQDTCKIKLGDRFYFQVDVLDFEGWPKVELLLVDSVAPSRRDFGLAIGAHDRNESGTVYFATLNSRLLGSVELCDEDEFSKIPLLLKKTVRTFLDTVAEYVLNPPEPHELVEVQTQAINMDEELDEVKEELSGVDVFSDELNAHNQNLIGADDTPIQEINSDVGQIDSIDDGNRLDEVESPTPLQITLD